MLFFNEKQAKNLFYVDHEKKEELIGNFFETH